MLSTPKFYIGEIVKPLVCRFEKEPTSYDLAFACCVLLYHFCDVLAHDTGDKIAKIKNGIASVNSHFEIVHAVAIAAKHVTVRNPKKIPALVRFEGLRSDDARVGSGAAFSDGSFFSDGTSFADIPDVVRVRTPDGTWHDLLHVVRSCARTLEERFV